MVNPLTDYQYKEIRKNAEAIYAKIGEVWCAALGDYVTFNSAGFRHLIRRDRRWRPHNDQKRRFLILPYAESIITAANVKVICRVGENASGKVIKFWAITGLRDCRKITVIIRQVGAGKKHFFSIYDQKTARQAKRSLDMPATGGPIGG
jgi:hypothetical protein